MLGFFTKRKKYLVEPTKENLQERINEALKLVPSERNVDQINTFKTLLKQRQANFDLALEHCQSDSNEKRKILYQYERLVNTLENCLTSPTETNTYINEYHNYNYYPVGIFDVVKPSPLAQRAALSCLGAGLGLIIGSMISFSLNPIFGTLLLAAGIITVLSASLFLLSPDTLETTTKKNEEKLMFQTGARLIDPELTFNEKCSQPAEPDRNIFNYYPQF